MTNKTTPHINVHDALELDGQPNTIIEYYKKWSETYDKDVTENYFAIAYICELMHQQLGKTNELAHRKTKKMNIVDVGCGTGLLGKPLQELGYRIIDGVDLSAEMIEKAKQTACYRHLYDGIDIHQPPPKQLLGMYDVAICLGVFTPGHVKPTALYHLAALTGRGGLIITSTRVPYYNSTDYQQVSDNMEAEGIVKLKLLQKNAPYRDDGDAHYWVYEVL